MFGFLRRRTSPRPPSISVSESLTVSMGQARPAVAVIERHGRQLHLSPDEAQKLALWLLDFCAWCDDGKAVSR